MKTPIILATTCLITQSAFSALVVTIGDGGDHAWASNGLTVDDTVTTTTSAAISATDTTGGAFTFTLQIESIDGTENLSNSFFGGDSLTLDGGLVNDSNDGFRFTVANISNSNVAFVGFSEIRFNSMATGENFEIDGIRGTAGTNGWTQDLTIAPFNTPTNGMTVSNPDPDNWSVRYVSLNFDSAPIPEPSSLLLSIAGVGLVAFRRKRC